MSSTEKNLQENSRNGKVPDNEDYNRLDKKLKEWKSS